MVWATTSIDASALPAGKILLDLLGNSNNDTIIGSAGNDKVLEAGGNDQLFLGAGNDVVEWNGSAGDDLIEGGSGVDLFLLSATDDCFTIDANGGRAFLARNDGASIDMDDVERIQFSASSAAAFVTVSDLTNTGIQLLALDLGDALGKSGNGKADSIGVNGTAGNDTIGATVSKGVVSVTGLASATDHRPWRKRRQPDRPYFRRQRRRQHVQAARDNAPGQSPRRRGQRHAHRRLQQ